MTKKLLTSLFGIALMAVSFSSHANTILISGEDATVACNDTTAPIVDPACLGFTGVGTTSSSSATVFSLGANSVANETSYLNTLIDTGTLLATDGAQVDAGGVDSITFTVTGQYFAIKSGFGHTFFENVGGIPLILTVVYDKLGQCAVGDTTCQGQSGGISHWTQWGGGGTTVPEPGTLLLLGAGLAGIGLTRRRRRVSH